MIMKDTFVILSKDTVDNNLNFTKLDKKTDDESALHVRLTCPASSDLRGEIYRKIKQTDWTLLDFHQETQSLENIFRQLTKEN